MMEQAASDKQRSDDTRRDASTSERIGISTVTSDAYAPGTIVLLHSFIAHHPDFDGDFVLVFDDLSDRWAERIETILGPHSLQWIPPSTELRRRVQRLAASEAVPSSAGDPHSASFFRRFFSLECARFDRYEGLIFLDSDILIRQTLTDLFTSDAPLLAAGDGAYFHGFARDRRTFKLVSGESGVRDPGAPETIWPTFNAGVIRYAGRLLGEATYGAMLEELQPERWGSPVQVQWADQRVLNLHFEGQATLLDARYNYLIRHREAIFHKAGIRLSDARVVHFNTPMKPWDFPRFIEVVERDPAAMLAWRWWNQAYTDAVASLLGARQVEGVKKAWFHEREK